MERMISYCGLDCTACPVFKATQRNDDAKRARVAEAWSKMFNHEFTVADINCDGCAKTDGKLFGHCANCAVRQCGMEKGLANCAHCADYACEKLTGLLAFIPNPAAKENLEEIRQGLGK
ncbi:MAG TPA: DUF3795 domain-containing protein [Spirochaetota bacterium]|nr:DUF3795 domain-containing protein [Spirochaetota bacterium]